jgi:hypothetical protein
MFDNLAQMMQPQQSGMQQPQGQMPMQRADPIANAGMLIMSGMLPRDAYVQGARMAREQEVGEIERQKQQVQQMQQLQLAQLLQGGGQDAGGFDQMSAQQKLGALVGSGQRLGDAAAAVTALQPNPLQNTFKGPGGALYQASTNPETKQLESKVIPGQMPEGTVMSAAEKRAQATEKTESSRAAAGAAKELRILEDLEKAFENYDKTSNVFTKAGSFLSSTKKAPFLNEEQTNAAIYNKKQLTYKNEIDKLNSQLYQARLGSVPAKMATDVFKQELEKGLPRTSITPEARKEIIKSKKREVAQSIIRNKFFNDWEKLNKGDRTGAEDAMRYIEENYEFVDENGRPNKTLLKELPRLVKELYAQEIGGDNPPTQSELTPNLMSEDEFDKQLNDEGFLNYLQQRAL